MTEITLAHEFLVSAHTTASERALAARALEMHSGRGSEVLVGGLGLGYTAREVLTSDRVGRVEVVGFLPQVIDWLDRGLVPLADELKGDPRFAVVCGDVHERLSAPADRQFDLVLIDVDHAPDDRLDDASGSLYTQSRPRRAAG